MPNTKETAHEKLLAQEIAQDIFQKEKLPRQLAQRLCARQVAQQKLIREVAQRMCFQAGPLVCASDLSNTAETARPVARG